MPELKFLPSLLAADQGRLTEACQRAEAAGAAGIHVDVMDGHFVPNLNFGPNVVEMAKAAVQIEVNVHLMITDPGKYAEAFIKAGADTLLIHIESDGDIPAVLDQIKKSGSRAGIVLNPDTPVENIFPMLDKVDEVLFMTVYPGFGGQSFIADVLPGITTLRARCPDLEISVDGGLNRESIPLAFAAGANRFDVGTGLFKPKDMKAEIEYYGNTLV